MVKNIFWSTVAFASLAHTAKGQSRPVLPISAHKIIVVAHRGDHVDVPENTLAAYEKGLSLAPNDTDFKESAERVRPVAK